MGIKIEIPESKEALTEFVRFYDQVYEYRDARWPAPMEFHLPILTGENPFAKGRSIRPFLARSGSKIIARAIAVMDDRYNRHWNEHLGHIMMFEAMPDGREATQLLMNAACEWLSERGAEAARAGFGLLDFPFAIDDYESLRPTLRGKIRIIITGSSRTPASNQRKVGLTIRLRFDRNWLSAGSTHWRARVVRNLRSCRSKMSLIFAALLNSPILGTTPSRLIGALPH